MSTTDNVVALPGANPPRLCSAKQVAEWLGTSQAWVLAHANGNRKPVLPSVKMGKMVRFRSDAVQQFIEECTR